MGKDIFAKVAAHIIVNTRNEYEAHTPLRKLGTKTCDDRATNFPLRAYAAHRKHNGKRLRNFFGQLPQMLVNRRLVVFPKNPLSV